MDDLANLLPVLPPGDLRPLLVPLLGEVKFFATSGLRRFTYRRVINRNNRLKRLLDLAAQEHYRT